MDYPELRKKIAYERAICIEGAIDAVGVTEDEEVHLSGDYDVSDVVEEGSSAACDGITNGVQGTVTVPEQGRDFFGGPVREWEGVEPVGGEQGGRRGHLYWRANE